MKILKRYINNLSAFYRKIRVKQILKRHEIWIKTDGKKGKRADLSGMNLSGMNLSYANFYKADLSYSNLSNANLSNAELSKANLSKADLSGANLSNTNLARADLSYSNLSKANLSNANLSEADLANVNLSLAKLSYAILSKADLSDACLYQADIRGVAFIETNFKGTMYENDIPLIINTEFYSIVKCKKYIQIGCEKHTKKEWSKFKLKDIKKMDGDKAVKFWKKYKKLVLS